MTDLKDTIAALSEAATQGEWTMRAHVIAPATASSKALDRWKLNVQHGPLGSFDRQDAEFIIAICNAYRSGQLVPVPSAEAAAEMVAQLRKLARKQEGYGMSFSDPSPRAGGMTSINLYGDRAKAAIWLFKNADRIADAVLAAMKGDGKP